MMLNVLSLVAALVPVGALATPNQGRALEESNFVYVAASAATRCIYANGSDVQANVLPAEPFEEACQNVIDEGWAVLKSWQTISPATYPGFVTGPDQTLTDIDTTTLWVKNSQCIISFSGSDFVSESIRQNGDLGLVTMFEVADGFPPGAQVNSLALKELTGIFETIGLNFTSSTILPIFDSCGTLTVAAHSLGGAIGGLFAYLANRDATPLIKKSDGTVLQVGSVYLFGSFLISKFVQLTNEADDVDGVFPGAHYYTKGAYAASSGGAAGGTPGLSGNLIDPVIIGNFGPMQYHLNVPYKSILLPPTTSSSDQAGVVDSSPDAWADFFALLSNYPLFKESFEQAFGENYYLHDNYITTFEA
ncbi:hypothetical protein AB1Y20_020364 [Prymnesium parvum]|uniref:Fungal lipase-like domain-containing protein n=1 Tax=Prymnesium parvum TaxID=97485 RepID=A0AB34JWX2_PRYPA